MQAIPLTMSCSVQPYATGTLYLEDDRPFIPSYRLVMRQMPPVPGYDGGIKAATVVYQ